MKSVWAYVMRLCIKRKEQGRRQEEGKERRREGGREGEEQLKGNIQMAGALWCLHLHYSTVALKMNIPKVRETNPSSPAINNCANRSPATNNCANQQP